MNLTVHVLIVWPKPGTAEHKSINPHSVMTYVEYGSEDQAYMAVRQLAARHEKVGWPTDQVTVEVASTCADPTSIAVTMALHQVGHRNGAHRGALLISRVDDDTARTVATEDAAAYLDTVHELQADTREAGYDTLVLRLGRRAEHGDPFACLALTELATEARLSNDKTVHADNDELTFTNVGGRR